MDLVNRRQVLVNLISRVGRGQQNIYRWVDELISIDAQLEQQEALMTTNYEYVVRFSHSEDYISDSSLAKLAVLWEGVVKDGDILTNLYPEDFIDDSFYFPIRAAWSEYIPKYSEVEAWEIPMPSEEEWQKATQDPSFLSGKPYTKWLESTQPWVMIKFTPAHYEWRTDSPSYSRESSDGYRSGGSGGGRTKHYQIQVPDTYLWQSAAGTQAETCDQNTPPRVFNKYTYQWYVERIQSEYKDAYFERQRKYKEEYKKNKPQLQQESKESRLKHRIKLEESKARQHQVAMALREKREAERAAEAIAQSAYEAELSNKYKAAKMYLLSIPGMKEEFLEEMRFGFYLLGGDRTKHARYADYFDSKRFRYNHVALWHQSHEPQDITVVTSEMLTNAAYYYAARQEDKLKDQYDLYKKAQGNKPIKSFEKWLQTA
ncbi:MAG: hypothetical protein ACK4XN_04335 [Dolichospermum sp.]|jgi:hypothetical protein